MTVFAQKLFMTWWRARGLQGWSHCSSFCWGRRLRCSPALGWSRTRPRRPSCCPRRPTSTSSPLSEGRRGPLTEGSRASAHLGSSSTPGGPSPAADPAGNVRFFRSLVAIATQAFTAVGHWVSQSLSHVTLQNAHSPVTCACTFATRGLQTLFSLASFL